MQMLGGKVKGLSSGPLLGTGLRKGADTEGTSQKFFLMLAIGGSRARGSVS